MTTTTTPADIIVSAARRARVYIAREEGGAEVTILAGSVPQALEAARVWAEGGDYGDEADIHVRVWLRRRGARHDAAMATVHIYRSSGVAR